MSELSTVPAHPAESTPLQKLPHYDFVGPVQDNELIQIVTPLLENSVESLPVAEIEKTPEQIALLSDMRSALTDYARDLGLDVSERLPGDGKVHFYDAAGIAKLRTALGKPKGWAGSTFSTGDIITVAPDGDDRQTRKAVHSLNHELLHAMSYVSVRISEDEDGNVDTNFSREGFVVNSTGAFSLMDELTAEAMNRTVQEQYWPNYPRLQAMIDASPDYAPEPYDDVMTLIAHPLIEKVAKQQGLAPSDVMRDLGRGQLTGDMKTLRQISGSLETEGMKAIAHHEHVKHVGELALKLGLSLSEPSVLVDTPPTK